MREVHERVYVGTELDCRKGDSEWVVVHACKSPCHQQAVGYRGNLRSTHPNYLVLEDDRDLYLNIIDPPRPLFMPSLFTSFLEFAGRHWDAGSKILIHCNKGESRAPSLAMLFLSKHIHAISDDTFDSARTGFRTIYPSYQPGRGIQIYLRQNWNGL